MEGKLLIRDVIPQSVPSDAAISFRGIDLCRLRSLVILEELQVLHGDWQHEA